MRKLIPIFIVLLLVAVPSLEAFWCEDGIPVCTIADHQRYPEIMHCGGGHSFIVWQDKRNTTDYDIYMQYLDENGDIQWIADGLFICKDENDQLYPRLTNDGGGGAIVAWQDERGSDSDIYAQRIKKDGAVQWAEGGVALCSLTNDQKYLAIVPDNNGGAIVIWVDYRSGATEIYAQKVSDVGKMQWTINGVPVCTTVGSKSEIRAIPDGANGAIIVWRDYRGTSSMTDIYAQRIDGSGSLLWTADGVEICTADYHQNDPQMISDGAGGAIITWTDPSAGDPATLDVFAQRVNSAGNVQWAKDGVNLCDQYYPKDSPQIATDGAGGAIVTWHENRYEATSSDVYAQRVSSGGTLLWNHGAINVTPIANGQGFPAIVSDGAGGAVIAWEDDRSYPSQINAQKIDGAGILGWRDGGAPISLSAQEKENLRLAEDGSGGAIAVWMDLRNSFEYDIYSQWVDSEGMVGYRPAVIASVSDIPGDEGGWVRLTIEKHSYDDAGWFRYPIYMYNVWRRVDDTAMLASIGKGTTVQASPEESYLASMPMREIDGRRFLVSSELPAQDFPPGTWEVLGSFNAFRQIEYLYVAATPADSTSTGVPMPVFCVSAHPLDPAVWYVSEPDSGYSVDNLAPAMPLGVSGEAAEGPPGITIDWDPNTESDFSYYIVHRGSFPGFIPSRSTELGMTSSPAFTDEYELWYDSYYKIGAVDRHGNCSSWAMLGPDDITGEEIPDVPRASYLGQNYPNPFNPSTTISFGLSHASHVKLSIYDAAGRLVRVVLDEDRSAGHYNEQWDGFDSRGVTAASGVYFYKLSTADLTETKKMVLLK